MARREEYEIRETVELVVFYLSLVALVIGFVVVIASYEEMTMVDMGILVMGMSFGLMVNRAIRELKERTDDG